MLLYFHQLHVTVCKNNFSANFTSRGTQYFASNNFVDMLCFDVFKKTFEWTYFIFYFGFPAFENLSLYFLKQSFRFHFLFVFGINRQNVQFWRVHWLAMKSHFNPSTQILWNFGSRELCSRISFDVRLTE